VLKIGGFLPKDYISNTAQRLDLYQRLYAVDNEAMLPVQAEIMDRFGALPEAVEATATGRATDPRPSAPTGED
jgi:transcription-repair coupling factor (superfamily II helicase)